MQFIAYQNNNPNDGCTGFNECPYNLHIDHMSRSSTSTERIIYCLSKIKYVSGNFSSCHNLVVKMNFSSKTVATIVIDKINVSLREYLKKKTYLNVPDRNEG
jgi:hypothetical protein